MRSSPGNERDGQFVDVALFDAVISLLSYQASAHLNASSTPSRMGNRHPQIAPSKTSSLRLTAISSWPSVTTSSSHDCARRRARAADSDERFATNPARVANYPPLRDRLVAALRERTRAEWIALLTTAGVPCGAVRDVPDGLPIPRSRPAR